MMTFNVEAQAVRRVAEAIERALTDAQVTQTAVETLWEALAGQNVTRATFDRAVEVLATKRRVHVVGGRIYLGGA